MTDPYQLLKVPRTATVQQITKAFRKLARKAHPDAGGDPEAFKELHLAYKVLTDPERRAKYDRTGEIDSDKPDNQLQHIMGVLSGVFQAVMLQCLQSNTQAAHVDFLSAMTKTIDTRQKEIAEQKKSQIQIRRFMEEAKTRFGVREGDNVMEAILEGNLAQLEVAGKALDEQLALNAEALRFLKRFTYRRDDLISILGRLQTTAANSATGRASVTLNFSSWNPV